MKNTIPIIKKEIYKLPLKTVVDYVCSTPKDEEKIIDIFELIDYTSNPFAMGKIVHWANKFNSYLKPKEDVKETLMKIKEHGYDFSQHTLKIKKNLCKEWRNNEDIYFLLDLGIKIDLNTVGRFNNEILNYMVNKKLEVLVGDDNTYCKIKFILSKN